MSEASFHLHPFLQVGKIAIEDPASLGSAGWEAIDTGWR